MSRMISTCVLLVLLALAPSAQARTITLTAEDCDEMAAISSLAPRLSWVMNPPNMPFNTQPTLYWYNTISLLMRFPIKEAIPKGQRITKADFTINPSYIAGSIDVDVRRLLAEWGTGVCYQYRMTYPKKLEWNQPGARGEATDRSNRASAVFKLNKAGEQTVDVTEDIELWYTGAAPNRGWVFTHYRDGYFGYFSSPYAPHCNGTSKEWKLQITYEPR